MIEKICNITIQGKCFDKEAKLSLFPGSDDRISLIFGRNGSGKSTIADAFQAYVNNDFTELAISLFDNNQIVQNIPETCRRRNRYRVSLQKISWYDCRTQNREQRTGCL